jgi:hypothetical protein
MKSVSEAIAEQKASHKALMASVTAWHKPAIKPRKKALKQSDIDAAVNAAIAAISFELRTHKNDLPRWSQAMDYAISVVQKHKAGTK